jgi:ferritin-like metal-binding protein YciE
VRDEELRTALSQHLEETRFHAARVEAAMRELGGEPAAARNAALAGLLEQHGAAQVTEPGLRDLFHACGAIATEHLELGLYEGLGDGAPGLGENRKEEEKALERVSRIAERLRGV